MQNALSSKLFDHDIMIAKFQNNPWNLKVFSKDLNKKVFGEYSILKITLNFNQTVFKNPKITYYIYWYHNFCNGKISFVVLLNLKHALKEEVKFPERYNKGNLKEHKVERICKYCNVVDRVRASTFLWQWDFVSKLPQNIVTYKTKCVD